MAMNAKCWNTILHLFSSSLLAACSPRHCTACHNTMQSSSANQRPVFRLTSANQRPQEPRKIKILDVSKITCISKLIFSLCLAGPDCHVNIDGGTHRHIISIILPISSPSVFMSFLKYNRMLVWFILYEFLRPWWNVHLLIYVMWGLCVKFVVLFWVLF